MPQGQAKECTFGNGVIDRCPLAFKIRQSHQVIGSRPRHTQQIAHLCVWILILPVRIVAKDIIEEPLGQAANCRHSTHHRVLVREEPVEPPESPGAGVGSGDGNDRIAATKHAHGVTHRIIANADGFSSSVDGARDNRRTFPQTGQTGCFWGNPTHHVGSPVFFR